MSLYTYYQSPIGLIEVAANDSAITQLYFVESQEQLASDSPLLKESVHQLDQYFRKERSDFDLPLEPNGTDFQQRVWTQLLTVKYGRAVSYNDIAKAIGDMKAVRAVGNANGKNPISIIIPCHRIIGSSGKLIGYGGGLWRKEWLLQHEGALLI